MNNTSQELLSRIRRLFEGVPSKLPGDDNGDGKLAESPIFVAGPGEFDHGLSLPSPEQGIHGDPADRWLDTPNTTFGGRCPRTFLQGTQKERDFLLGIIESVEDGAF